MTPLQTKWIEALRNGGYEQAQGRLRIGNAFCCLGVACDVVPVEGTWNVVGAASSAIAYYEFEMPNGLDFLDTELSYELMQLYGMDVELMDELIGMNDAGKSFDEIADRLEQEWSS